MGRLCVNYPVLPLHYQIICIFAAAENIGFQCVFSLIVPKK